MTNSGKVTFIKNFGCGMSGPFKAAQTEHFLDITALSKQDFNSQNSTQTKYPCILKDDSN